MKKLTQQNKILRKGPVVLVIMDGVGLGTGGEEDAFAKARTPILDDLMKNHFFTKLTAHGIKMGLPSDSDMGNSEVGHNVMGAGRIFAQGAKLVNESIESGNIFKSEVWKEIINKPKNENTTIHFIGLLSDGNVHSHINHLKKLINECSLEKIKKVRIHILLDGRDVPETSALNYVEDLENFLLTYKKSNFDYYIASGGGRMITTMDRYEADWNIVKRGWDTHVLGKGKLFNNAKEAIEFYRKENKGIIDQYLPPFVIKKNDNSNEAIGKINNGDSVIFFNFRGDRAIEISRAFEEKNFNKFDREFFPNVTFAGMMLYDGDLNIPKKFLVSPPFIKNTISEYLVNINKTQCAISETQKFGHVTYFWNGNKSGKFNEKLEDYFEISSDKVMFNERPWMKAAEITDKTIEAIKSKKYNFIRLNYPNGDMVGHTGDFEAAVIAIESIDICLKRLLNVVKEENGILFVCADHGNLDEMYEIDKSKNIKIDENGKKRVKTSHTLNKVPAIIYDPGYNGEYEINKDVDGSLGNIAATILMLMDLDVPDDFEPSIIKLK